MVGTALCAFAHTTISSFRAKRSNPEISPWGRIAATPAWAASSASKGRTSTRWVAGFCLAPHERRELKFLHRSPGRRVLVPQRVDQRELCAEQGADGFGAVAGDGEAGAFLRSVQRKGRDDGVA